MIRFRSWSPATLTVGELIEKLKEYPQDLAVIATWEGTVRAIYPPCFELRTVTCNEITTHALLIDVEEICEAEE